MAQELIISEDGIFAETRSRVPVINPEAVANQLLGDPSFFLPLEKESHLHLFNKNLYYITRITELPIKTVWSTFTDSETEESYETPTFITGAVLASRTYTPQLPTFLITSMHANESAPTYPIEHPDSGLRLWLLSIKHHEVRVPVPENPDETKVISRLDTFSLPFANVYANGVLCTGPLPKADNFYELTAGVVEGWKSNEWNKDLFSIDSQRLCPQLVRFDPKTGEQLPATDEDPAQLHRQCATELPKEVLEKLKGYVPLQCLPSIEEEERTVVL